MAPTNTALVLPTPKSPTQTIGSAPYSPPSAGEIVIKAHAVAINPADWGIQRNGVLIPEEDGYPCILGCDVAGEVVELPESTDGGDKDLWIKNFRVGDRVIGQTGPLFTKSSSEADLSARELKFWEGKKIYAYAAFQSYVVLRGPMVAKIPVHVSYEDAAVLPLGITTAASCLFPKTMLNLDFPRVDGPPAKKNQILLVWGASSSVGSCGVQLATLAGYDVIGICGARNHEMVASLGAIKCFDHNSTTIVGEVIDYLNAEAKGKEVVGAYDAISTAPTIGPLCEILHKAGGRNLVACTSLGAEQHSKHEVQVIVNITQGMEQFYETAGKVRDWLEVAMKDGRIEYMPEKEILGKGLEFVQAGMDRLAEMKVSGRKLVVTL